MGRSRGLRTDPLDTTDNGSLESDDDAYERKRKEANRLYEEQRKADHEAAEARRRAASDEHEKKRRDLPESDD